jgi:EH domain-containing protein 3
VHRAHHLPVGDFPDVTRFRGVMEGHDLSKFPKLSTSNLEAMDSVLSKDIPRLMAMFPQEGTNTPQGAAVGAALTHVGGNLAALPAPPPPQPQLGYNAPPSAPTYSQPYPTNPPPGPSPFDAPAAPAGGVPWAVTPADKARYDEVFNGLNPTNGLASGMAVRPILERSGLPVDVLRQVWNLSDIDRDGSLDRDEFSVAMHLARESTSGKTLPPTLPIEMIPPSKR